MSFTLGNDSLPKDKCGGTIVFVVVVVAKKEKKEEGIEAPKKKMKNEKRWKTQKESDLLYCFEFHKRLENNKKVVSIVA